MTIESTDHDELLIWTILSKLERLAFAKYQQMLPSMATPEKQAIVAELTAKAPTDAALVGSPLHDPVRDLLEAANSSDQTHTLIVQGIVLERLGQIIYKLLAARQQLSQSTRSMATSGLNACNIVISEATRLIRHQVGDGERLFSVFCESADGVLRRLDGLGEGVDRLFGQRFGLTFSEVLGEFTAELLPACQELGISRRKLVCHLAGVFMGM